MAALYPTCPGSHPRCRTASGVQLTDDRAVVGSIGSIWDVRLLHSSWRPVWSSGAKRISSIYAAIRLDTSSVSRPRTHGPPGLPWHLSEPSSGTVASAPLNRIGAGGPRKVVPSLTVKVVPCHWRNSRPGGPMSMGGDNALPQGLSSTRDHHLRTRRVAIAMRTRLRCHAQRVLQRRRPGRTGDGEEER